MNKIARSFVAIFIIVLLVSINISYAVEREVKIGVITDLSGLVAYWGTQTRIGAELAAKEINRNNDVKLKIIYGDHKLNTKFAVSEAQKIINIDEVDAIYSEFTPTSIAISSLVKNKNMLMIYAAAAESPVKSSKNIFKTYMDFVEGCKLVARSWKDKGFERIGSFSATMEFSDLCLEGVREIYPNIEIVYYNPGDDVATQTLVLKSKNIQGVVNPAFEPDLINMLNVMQKIGFTPEIGTNSDAFTKNAQNKFRSLSNKIYIFNFSPVSQDFIEKVEHEDEGNNLVSIESAALAYTHIKQLYNAVKTCSKKDINCKINTLSKSQPDETIGFRGWKDRIASFKIGIYQRKSKKLIEINR